MKLTDKILSYREQPSPVLWDRISDELALDSKPQKVEVRSVFMFYKIAAVFIFIAVVLVGVSVNLRSYNDSMFVSNHNAPIKLEELGKSSEPYYDLGNMEKLRKAYAVLR